MICIFVGYNNPKELTEDTRHAIVEAAAYKKFTGSLRRVAAQFGVHHETVRQCLKKEGYIVYKCVRAQVCNSCIISCLASLRRFVTSRQFV